MNQNKTMDSKIEAAIQLAIKTEKEKLLNQLKSLDDVTFRNEDLFYKAAWSDSYYPGCPEGEKDCKTLDEAVQWMSQQDHPMGFSGCHIHIGLYVYLFGKETLIETFDFDKLYEK